MDIFGAVRNNDIEGVKKALEMGVDVNVKNNDGHTPLIEVGWWGRTKIVQLLIDRGANINEKDNYGYTALIWAVRNGHQETAQLLIDRDANINEKDDYGRTALMWAVMHKNEKIVKLLLDNGAKNIPNNKRETPFKMAIDMNNKKILKLFLTTSQTSSEELFGNQYGYFWRC